MIAQLIINGQKNIPGDQQVVKAINLLIAEHNRLVQAVSPSATEGKGRDMLMKMKNSTWDPNAVEEGNG